MQQQNGMMYSLCSFIVGNGERKSSIKHMAVQTVYEPWNLLGSLTCSLRAAIGPSMLLTLWPWRLLYSEVKERLKKSKADKAALKVQASKAGAGKATKNAPRAAVPKGGKR